jgi:predicted nucleic acid-binding protein
MLYLIDTGILIRFFDRADPHHPSIIECFRVQEQGDAQFFVTFQNLAEFWNVATRPVNVRGGYGWSVAETALRLRMLEEMCSVLPDSASCYEVWRELVTKHEVKGAQVHDAKLIAAMHVNRISKIVTLNQKDFHRYQEVTALSPAEFLDHLK